MANLMITQGEEDPTDWGPVLESDYAPEFPCMDSAYQWLTWKFSILKHFDGFDALVEFETSTIPGYFTNRVYDVSYAKGEDELAAVELMKLQEYKRKEIVSPGDPGYPKVAPATVAFQAVAVYDVVFTKENA